MNQTAICSSLPGSLGWDADGVIVDSLHEAWRAVEDISALFGQRPQIRCAADKDIAFDRAAQARLAGEDGAATLRAMHRILMRDRTAQVGMFGAILDLIAKLPVPPPLISAAYAAGIRQVLGERCALFASIAGCEDGPKDQLLATAAAAGLRWYVTDTRTDVGRCQTNGIKTIAVGWGYDDATQLRAAGADIVVETATQLAEVLNRLGFSSPA